MASDSDSEFDLSPEDENLLASLVENTASKPADASVLPNDAPNNLPSSSQARAALVGIARTNSVNAFVHKIQPQSTPSVIPADDVTYPDRRCRINLLAVVTAKVLTDLQDPSRSGLDQFGANRNLRAAQASNR